MYPVHVSSIQIYKMKGILSMQVRVMFTGNADTLSGVSCRAEHQRSRDIWPRIEGISPLRPDFSAWPSALVEMTTPRGFRSVHWQKMTCTRWRVPSKRFWRLYPRLLT